MIGTKIFTVLVVQMLLFSSVLSYSVLKGPRETGELTRAKVISMYVDAFVTKYLEKTEGLTWDASSDISGEYVGFVPVGDDGDKTMQMWQKAAHYIAFDGTDAQVSRTGLSREELFRRSEIKEKMYPGKSFEEAKTAYLSGIANAIAKWPQDPVAPIAFTRPGPAKVYLGFNQDMDYGSSDNWFTLRAVPQDFADPRVVGGKSVKEWMMGYNFLNGSQSGHPETDGANVSACFSPDFTGAHHNLFNEGYPLQSPLHGGEIWRFISNVEKGLPVQLQWKSSLSHMDDQSLMALRHTGMHGWYASAGGLYFSQLATVMQSSWLYSVYGEKNALAFLAKSLESIARHEYTYTEWNNSVHSWAFINSWRIFRYIGADFGPCPNYKEASKMVHGSYWYKNYRYGLHRTPDKLVTVSWNGKATGGGLYSDIEPKSGYSYYVNGSLRYHSEQMEPSGDMVVTQVVPDNTDSLADNETYLVRAHGRMQGSVDNLSYHQSAVEARVNMSDAVLSTAGHIDIMQNWYNEYYAKQYQSFTSFYDKTCISMVHFKPHVNGRGQNWSGGFSASFHADSVKPLPGRMCYFEGDSVDLNPYAVKTGYDEQKYYPIGGHQKNLTGSKWWSVNGRIGIAVLGGDQGYFKIFSDYSSGASRGGLFDPSVMIGYECPIGTPDSKNNQLSMAAAYFTDTPPAKVKALQATLTSIDAQLPDGWKGVTASTPDDQRVLALARFYGTDNRTASLKLSFPEGAPVLEGVTTITGDTARADLSLDTLESLGQTMAFYVSGATDTVIAQQIGDITMRIKGNSTVTLKYLSRANANTLYVNGVASSKTRQELATGVSIALTSGWMDVRVTNAIDEDHTGPAVEVVNPVYLSDFDTRGVPSGVFWDPHKTVVSDSGLKVQVRARDRSGVAYVKVYLDWALVDSITQAPYEIVIPKSAFCGDSVHAIHAVACDRLGNTAESFSVPIKTVLTDSNPCATALEGRHNIVNHASLMSVQTTSAKTGNGAHGKNTREMRTANVTAVANGNVFTARVKPEAGRSAKTSGVSVSFNGKDYLFCLNAFTNKAYMFRKDKESMTILGEAHHQVSTQKWYDLKVKAADNKLTGYVNGEEKVSIEE